MQFPMQGAGDGQCRVNDPSRDEGALHLHAHQSPTPQPLDLHAHVREDFHERSAQIDAIQQERPGHGSW